MIFERTWQHFPAPGTMIIHDHIQIQLVQALHHVLPDARAYIPQRFLSFIPSPTLPPGGGGGQTQWPHSILSVKVLTTRHIHALYSQYYSVMLHGHHTTLPHLAPKNLILSSTNWPLQEPLTFAVPQTIKLKAEDTISACFLYPTSLLSMCLHTLGSWQLEFFPNSG